MKATSNSLGAEAAMGEVVAFVAVFLTVVVDMADQELMVEGLTLINHRRQG